MQGVVGLVAGAWTVTAGVAVGVVVVVQMSMMQIQAGMELEKMCCQTLEYLEVSKNFYFYIL